jgi:hypothetical protein
MEPRLRHVELRRPRLHMREQLSVQGPMHRLVAATLVGSRMLPRQALGNRQYVDASAVERRGDRRAEAKFLAVDADHQKRGRYRHRLTFDQRPEAGSSPAHS